jgi:N-acetylglutamate synthase-like GNAT family acetyltransferase
MPRQPNKIRRHRATGELTVEQTQDLSAIIAMLQHAGMSGDVSANAGCFLMAYWGNDPVGIVGLETRVDAALMHPLFVLETMRRHGIGASLVRAVRVAAHTRGARMLYATIPSTSMDYFARFGFIEVGFAQIVRAFGDTSKLQRTRLGDTPECRAIHLDISRDGLIER